MSKGAQQLESLLRELFGPEVCIKSEYNLGNNLRLDYYLPAFSLGFEYHGRQHAEFVEHFHDGEAGFYLSKRRDAKKEELCEEMGIGLVVIWFNENLTADLLKGRIEAVQARVSQVKTKQVVEDPYREKRLQRAREARRERYLREKERKFCG